MKLNVIKIISAFLFATFTMVFPSDMDFDQSKANKVAEWTVLVCFQADNDLCDFAIRNLKDMAKVGSNEKVNIVAQIEQPHKKGLWRYMVNKRNIELVEHVPTNDDCIKDVVGAAKWAFNKYPSKHTALVEWNHGCGILDPSRWGSAGMPHANLGNRGIYFNFSTGTYMNNQQHAEALRQIKEDVLGKKIDIVGMDACLMAGFEIAYQVKNYADLFVASEDIELALGWSYFDFLLPLTQGGISPSDLAQSIVLTYNDFYKNKISWYTQSAVDLSHMDLLRDSIDQVVIDVNACIKKFGLAPMKNIVRESRRASLQFNTSCYIDLHSFLYELSKRLNVKRIKTVSFDPDPFDEYSALVIKEEPIILNRWKDSCLVREKEDTENYKTSQLSAIPELMVLHNTIVSTMELIEHLVIANVYGDAAASARGLSIYFPQYGIDPSYGKTRYAQESLWVDFLRKML